MVTTENIRNRIDSYKKHVRDLSAEAKQAGSERMRVFRKRLKRSQRKLVSMIREQERHASASDRKKSPDSKS